jgi:hypothetical protein
MHKLLLLSIKIYMKNLAYSMYYVCNNNALTFDFKYYY